MSLFKSLNAVVAAILLLASAHASAAVTTDLEETPSAEAMTFDLLIVRPISLVATVAGCGLFILSLPFDLLQWNFADPANRLVVEPARFTFTRDLGTLE